MAKRVVDDASLTAVAGAIRAKTGKTDGLTFPSDFETSVEDVFAAGEKAEYNRFWDALQDFGNRTNYTSCFGGAGWTDDSFRPKYDIKPTIPNYMFERSGIVDLVGILEDCGVSMDFSQCGGFQDILRYCTGITHFPTINFSAHATFRNGFRFASGLVSASFTNVTPAIDWTYGFQNCLSLTDVTFSGTIGTAISFEQSSKLSKSSIESVFNALSSTTTGLSVTLSLVAVNAAFETSEGLADGSTCAEWTELANTKSNWTINLV